MSEATTIMADHIRRLQEKLRIVADTNKELGDENVKLWRTLEELVDRLTFIENDDAYKAVWIMFSIHGGRYGGPTYTAELENARQALGRASPEDGDPA